MSSMNEIEKVNFLMKQKKIRQADIARLTNEHPNKVGQWFIRKSVPKKHLKKVAAILGTTVDYLLD